MGLFAQLYDDSHMCFCPIGFVVYNSVWLLVLQSG